MYDNKPNIVLATIILTVMLCLTSFVAWSQKQINNAHPAPKGILIFVGQELANGVRVDEYTIERSGDKRKWEMVCRLQAPSEWEIFAGQYKKWSNDFAFQHPPIVESLREKWGKCEAYGIIDSMGYYTTITPVLLAAGLTHYDQDVKENTKVWYRTKSYKNDIVLSDFISSPVQFPEIPEFDDITLDDKNLSKDFLYLKWKSKGTNPAPAFEVRFYENDKINKASGDIASYKVDNTTYFLYQEPITSTYNQRQYFMNPLDFFGNKGIASKFAFISSSDASPMYFKNVNIEPDTSRLGIKLTWVLDNPKEITGLNIYKSTSFDKEDYSLIATIPQGDSYYVDNNVIPDKIYYYYIETFGNDRTHTINSSVAFGSAYDNVKPVMPVIYFEKDIPNGVELKVKARDMNLSGVRIYRNDGISPTLYPISHVIPLNKGIATYIDTSNILRGNLTFTYAATSINNSSLESEMSSTIHVIPDMKTTPPSPNDVIAEEDGDKVVIGWEDVYVRHREVQGYNIYRRNLPDGNFILLNSKDKIITIPSYIDETADTGNHYEYAIQTVDIFGGTSESMVLAQIQLNEYNTPMPTAIWVKQDNSKATVEWSKPTDNIVKSINVYRYQRGNKPVLLKQLNTDIQSYEDKTTSKGELYFYFITFTDNKNLESAPSREAGIRVE